MGIGVIMGFVAIPYPFQQIGSAVFIFSLGLIVSVCSFKARLAALGASIFFVYATHEPLQTIMAKAWLSLHIPAYGTLFCFLVIPAITFSLCMGAYFTLHKIAPRILAFITGGR